VLPAVFLPVAEQTGCIVALGDWVLKTACQEAARWPAAVSVAVNISSRQLQDGNRLFNAVRSALETSGLAPERLELEITGSLLPGPDAAEVLQTLHRFRASGVHITLDDFDSTSASLTQLRSFPFDRIKMDRSFVADLAADDDAAAMVRAIVALGDGVATTPAGGETTAQQAPQIGTFGCADIQAYPLSRPIPGAEIEAVLSRYFPTPGKVAITA
jgi:EAL domain-containing protein (putative c-di-GMP-specific phosphodiesterase class I)